MLIRKGGGATSRGFFQTTCAVISLRAVCMKTLGEMIDDGRLRF